MQCLRDNVELLCNAAEMFYNGGDYNNAKSFFQRVIHTRTYLDKCSPCLITVSHVFMYLKSLKDWEQKSKNAWGKCWRVCVLHVCASLRICWSPFCALGVVCSMLGRRGEGGIQESVIWVKPTEFRNYYVFLYDHETRDISSLLPLPPPHHQPCLTFWLTRAVCCCLSWTLGCTCVTAGSLYSHMQAHSLDPCVLQGMDTYAFLLSQGGCGNNEGLEK